MNQRILAGALSCLAVAANTSTAQELIAIDWNDGLTYAISVTQPSMEQIGSLDLDLTFGIDTGPDGTTYVVASSTLYRLDVETLQTTAIGQIQNTLFEGALAIAPDGRAFLANGFNATAAQLIRLDLSSAATSIVGTMGGGQHDVNGMVWREDGLLVALDRVTNGLLVVDPDTANVVETIPLAPTAPTVGAVGGMAMRNGLGYLSTSGTGGSNPGSNALYRVNLYNGNLTLVLEFDGVSSIGISGLTHGPSLTPTPYCTAKTNSLGCLPSISSTGVPSASASGGFVAAAVDVRNNTLGVGCYSTNGADATPFQGGFLCMRAPILRTPAFVSRGSSGAVNDCSGVYRIDLNAFAAGELGGSPSAELSVPGTRVQFQFWGRDKPALDGSTLTNALGFTVGP